MPNSRHPICLGAPNEAFIKKSYADALAGHNSRDATAIAAREKPLKKQPAKKTAAKQGRPKHGEERAKLLARIEKQASGMGLADMLDGLPKACDIGTKTNSKGYKVMADARTQTRLSIPAGI